jgi:hypothetical protein
VVVEVVCKDIGAKVGGLYIWQLVWHIVRLGGCFDSWASFLIYE